MAGSGAGAGSVLTSASGCGAAAGAGSAGAAASGSGGNTPKWRRSLSAISSSTELECVFFSVMPNSGSSSIMRFGFTSSSRASSLIRIFPINLPETLYLLSYLCHSALKIPTLNFFRPEPKTGSPPQPHSRSFIVSDSDSAAAGSPAAGTSGISFSGELSGGVSSEGAAPAAVFSCSRASSNWR